MLEAELAGGVPVVRSSVAGTRIVGRLCVGEERASPCCFSGEICFSFGGGVEPLTCLRVRVTVFARQVTGEGCFFHTPPPIKVR